MSTYPTVVRSRSRFGWVDDATCDRKRSEILESTGATPALTRMAAGQPRGANRALAGRLELQPFGAEGLCTRRRVQQRQILDAMTSNWTVEDGKPLHVAKKPLSLLPNASSRPTWWTTCVRLRTWLFETTDFYLPDMKLETEHEGSLTENPPAA